MGWGRHDDEFDEHPKVLAVLEENDEPDAAAALAIWVLSFSYVNRNRRRGKTPGFVPSGLPRRYLGSLGRRGAEILVKHRLWDAVDGGWVFHDYDDYLPSAKTREKRAAAGRKGAAARWHKDDTGEAEQCESDGKLPSDDGNELSDDGKPMASDGNVLANDGSRARARREPTPTPITQTQRAEDQTLFPLAPRDGASEPARKTTAQRNADDPLFGEFYNTYPRKKEPTDARKAWDKMIKAADPQTIIEGARRLAAEVAAGRKDLQFTPYPASWLRAGGWADEPDPPPGQGVAVYRQSPNGHRPSTADSRVAATLHLAAQLEGDPDDPR